MKRFLVTAVLTALVGLGIPAGATVTLPTIGMSVKGAEAGLHVIYPVKFAPQKINGVPTMVGNDAAVDTEVVVFEQGTQATAVIVLTDFSPTSESEQRTQLSDAEITCDLLTTSASAKWCGDQIGNDGNGHGDFKKKTSTDKEFGKLWIQVADFPDPKAPYFIITIAGSKAALDDDFS